MYTARIHFYPSDTDNLNEFIEHVTALPELLRMNGQICGREFPAASVSEGYVLFVLASDIDSLDEKYNNRYIKEYINKINSISKRSVLFEIIGRDPVSIDTCSCKFSASYILYTNYVLLESPLRCGDCFLPIPLYRIPSTSNDEYNDIIVWQSDYQSCDRLYMNDGVLVRCSKRELSHENSNLSKNGISICKRIYKLTNKPTYYRLIHTKKNKQLYKCPICGQDWHIDPPWHGKFHFKCDTCFILSSTM